MTSALQLAGTCAMAEPSRGFRPALRALVLVRLKEFFREPEALFWIYGFPIILAAVQPIIRALPLTALVDALRAVMLEGASLGGIGSQLLVLLAWLVVGFLGALKLFRWQ